jgi:hypothetical protein
MESVALMPEIVNNAIIADTDCQAIEMSRNDEIIYRHLIKGERQDEIASKFNISRQRVGKICQLYFEDEKTNKRVVSKWKKDLAHKTMQTAMDICQSIDISKLSDNSKPTHVGILVDKSLILTGEGQGQTSTQINIVNYGDVTIK